FTDSNTQLNLVLTLLTYGAITILGVGILYWILRQASNRSEMVQGFFMKGKKLGKTFLDGILAIRELKNWPLFIFHTSLIWFLYIFMTYVGFWMFDMHEIYSIGMTEALVLTMVSAVGLSIPTPGGLGTYHLFITKSLFILYGVPEATGLAYATIAHASTIVIVVISSPALLAIDKFVVMKRGASD
ncbi:MAG: lysylphosphatidylglycerol synthase domain-containing protein, partial [Balneolaceae bacterium]